MIKSPQPARLPSGGLIDRTRPLAFTFDGKSLSGFHGDTLASALIANGTRLIGRSFKYHRPRGILTAGVEEPNALVEMRGGARREPNTRATTAELYAGLVAASQNRWPSLALDLLSVNQLVSPFLAAGFYYKTFMWPASFWEKLYEPLIRRAAGLGRGAGEEDPDTYEKAYAFCDVLVIGSGPAGLMAARVAGRAGARVILCEEDFVFGGRLLAEKLAVDGTAAAEWVADVVAELATMPNVTLMPRTSVAGVYDGGTYAAVQRVSDHLPEPPPFQPRQRLWKIVAKRAVLASGAIERGIVFGGNDLPGVMMAGAVRSYLNRFAVAPMQRLAVFTCNDSGWRTVADARAAGLTVAAVIDTRTEIAAELRALAKHAGAELFLGGQVNDALGGRSVEAIDIRAADGRHTRLAVDGLAMSGGWNLNIGLASHLGHKPVWRESLAAFAADALPPGLAIAGAAAGGMTLAECLPQGAAEGARAAADTGHTPKPSENLACGDDSAALTAFWHVENARGKAFVDFQNDVTDKDIAIAYSEGFRSVEHLKRYTTLGMATDQGKLGNVPGMALMATLTGRDMAATGTTVLRPPHIPVALGAFAGHHRGRHFRPVRLSPLHKWSAARNASFTEIGAWLRPEFYPLPGEKDWLTACTREVNAVRSAVGLCDVSTLGKIDVMGADAGIFLDRVYANTFSTLAVGKIRYGLMLREDGHVLDDGTCARLAPGHFVMSTTTANAVKVMQHLEFCLQVIWPELDVQLASVSEQWAQMALAGPRARNVLREVVDPAFDLSDGCLPYMGYAEVTVCGGTPARLFRLSFCGELAYEIAVAARFGGALAEAIMQAGAAHGIVPYGLEALNVMRIEKGHVTGAEINGQTTAQDLGLGKMVSTKKDFVGRVLAQRPGLADPLRPALVGFKPVDKSARLRSGAHFVAQKAEAIAANDEGFMTSCCYSPSTGCWIGLGLLRGGAARIGDVVRAIDPIRNAETDLIVCSPHFVDPAGERLRPAAAASGIVAAVADRRVPPAGEKLPLHLAVSDRDYIPPGHYGSTDGPAGMFVQMHEYPAMLIVIARKGQQAALSATMLAHFGLALPAGPKRVVAGELAAISLAPAQWLVTGPPALARQVTNACEGLASVSDQTDSRRVLRLSGPDVRQMLAKGVPLDLHPEAFQPGDAAATIVSHISTWMWQLDDAPAYELAVPRSMAGSFADWLKASAAEFGMVVG